MVLGDFANNALLLLKHKDLLRKQIKSVSEVSDSQFTLNYVDKKVDVTANKVFEGPIAGLIVCENSTKNVDTIVAHWDELLKLETTIILLNPKDGSNWSLTPHVHQRISGKDDVKKGLKAIYKMSL